jgi:hypothetical protein
MDNEQARYAEELLDVMAIEDYGTQAQDLCVADLLDDLSAVGLALIKADGVAGMAYLKVLMGAQNDK